MPRGIRVGDEMRDRIADMTRAGHTQEEIARMTGLSKAAVRRAQVARNVAPSNIKGGWSARRVVCPKRVEPEQQTKEDYVLLDNKTISLVGFKTSFRYTCGIKQKDLTIETGYGEPFAIDIKDLVGFANELLAVAEKAEAMRKDI